MAPAVDAPERPAFLRWMTFVPAAIYAMYTIRDFPERWVDGAEARKRLDDRAIARILACWRMMEADIHPAPHLLGTELSVLDVYAAVVSRWEPGRPTIAAECPRLAGAVGLVDADPRLAAFWAERFPFEAA